MCETLNFFHKQTSLFQLLDSIKYVKSIPIINKKILISLIIHVNLLEYVRNLLKGDIHTTIHIMLVEDHY